MMLVRLIGSVGLHCVPKESDEEMSEARCIWF